MFERPPFDTDTTFTAWLERDAHLRPPDALLERVLSGTAATRRRPAWRVMERWFPMETRARFGAVPRTAVVLVTLGLLAVILAAIAVGSQPDTKLPAPYGLARNGPIAFAVDGDIRLVDPDGSNDRAIIEGPELDRYPWFSLDGTKVLFGRGPDDDLALMMANADGTGVTRLMEKITWADITPDMTKAYGTRTVDGRLVLSVMELDGSGTNTDLPIGDIEPMGWVLARPPDGRELVFVGHPTAGSPVRALYAIGIDGTGLRQIGDAALLDDPDEANNATDAPSSSFSFQDPSMSPDGRTIAFWNWEIGAGRPTSDAYMHLRDLDTGLELPVPYGGDHAGGSEQLFSPDGQTIAFNSAYAVNVAPVDGSEAAWRARPSFDFNLLNGFDFSPDGTKLLLSLKAPGTSVIIDIATNTWVEVPGLDDAWGWQRLAP